MSTRSSRKRTRFTQENIALAALNDNMPDGGFPDIQALKQRYAMLGGDANKRSILNDEMAVRKKALAEHTEYHRKLEASRPASDRRWAAWIRAGLNLLAGVFTTTFVVVGLSLGIIAVFVSEIIAVERGFALLDPHNSILPSIAIVVFFIAGLFIREMVSRDSAVEPEELFSLRHVWRWLKYTLGIGQNWKPVYSKNANLLKSMDSALRVVTWVILFFSLLGRLLQNLQHVEGNWRDALLYIVNNATLTEMAGYFGAPIAVFGLLTMTHFAVHFIYEIFFALTGGVQANFTSGELASPEYFVERELKNYWQNAVMQLESQKQLEPAN